MLRRVTVLLLAVPHASSYFCGTGVRHTGIGSVLAQTAVAARMSAPAVLAEAEWMPELQACCTVSDAAGGPEDDGETRMEQHDRNDMVGSTR